MRLWHRVQWNKILRLVHAPKHPVESLWVHLNDLPAETQQRSQFRVLVEHLFGRFFEGDDPTAHGQTRARILHIGVSLGIPGLMWTLALIPSYYGIVPYGVARPHWLQIQDHFLCIVYSFVTVGVVALMKWDMFLPDLLDVRILTVMPLHARRLFIAKVCAILLFLAFFLVGANLPTTIFLPAIAESASFLRHIAAHLLAVSLAAIFAAASCLSLVAFVTKFLRSSATRALVPVLQGLLMAVLLMLLFLSPLLSPLLKPLLQSDSRIVYWFPPAWFLGLYQVVMGSTEDTGNFQILAALAIAATLLSVSLLLALYPLAYRKRVVQVIEGESGGHASRRYFAWVTYLLNRYYLPAAGQRATYYFVTQTLFRIQRYRIYIALALSVGVSVATMYATSFAVTNGSLVAKLSSERLAGGSMIFIFSVIGGVFLCLRSPTEPGASWLFTSIVGQTVRDLTSGTRRWVVIFSVGAAAALAVPVYLLSQRQSGNPMHLLSDMGFCLLLTELFFLSFQRVPFTPIGSDLGRDLPTVVQHCVLACIALPAVMMVEGWIEQSWLLSVVWLASLLIATSAFNSWYLNLDASFASDDIPESAQQLGL